MRLKKRLNKEEVLKSIIEDILWMAARYANGRSTYAPRIIRDVVDDLKLLYPDWKIKKDITIRKPDKYEVEAYTDYLYDIFNPDNES